MAAAGSFNSRNRLRICVVELFAWLAGRVSHMRSFSVRWCALAALPLVLLTSGACQAAQQPFPAALQHGGATRPENCARTPCRAPGLRGSTERASARDAWLGTGMDANAATEAVPSHPVERAVSRHLTTMAGVAATAGNTEAEGVSDPASGAADLPDEDEGEEYSTPRQQPGQAADSTIIPVAGMVSAQLQDDDDAMLFASTSDAVESSDVSEGAPDSDDTMMPSHLGTDQEGEDEVTPGITNALPSNSWLHHGESASADELKAMNVEEQELLLHPQQQVAVPQKARKRRAGPGGKAHGPRPRAGKGSGKGWLQRLQGHSMLQQTRAADSQASTAQAPGPADGDVSLAPHVQMLQVEKVATDAVPGADSGQQTTSVVSDLPLLWTTSAWMPIP